MITLNMTDMLYTLSDALDFVERDLVGVTTNHAKRVAYISARIGAAMQLSDAELVDLAACALLHDNALTEYIHAEYQKPEISQLSENEQLKLHCIYGERNIKNLPFQTKVTGAILYHHEKANGTGPFGKRSTETPLFARIIHLADALDAHWNFSEINAAKYEDLAAYLESIRDIEMDTECINAFLQIFEYSVMENLRNETITDALQQAIPHVYYSYTNTQILEFAALFARIIDFKSQFTSLHSIGIAEKAQKLGAYYGFSDEKNTKLYLAGALHDIGKLCVNTDILEKPDKLTDTEYTHIQSHAFGTYTILQHLHDLPDVAAWAYNHHEKLDGSGYPFAKTAAELSTEDRIMACLDIYQALTEERPYKKGMPHARAIAILQDLAARGQLDKEVVKKIDDCFGTAT